jgi:predicted RNA-binding protein with PIN domain
MSLHFLIDGYNLIKRNPALASKSLEDGRQAFISLVERNRPQGSPSNQVTVVFDGKPGMYGFPVAHEIRVVFTEYETADDLIKRRVEGSKNKKNIVVVTDDRALLLYVRGCGACVMSCSDFLKRASSAKMSPKGKRSSSGNLKVITSTFEHAVNQEFENIWLKKKDKSI